MRSMGHADPRQERARQGGWRRTVVARLGAALPLALVLLAGAPHALAATVTMENDTACPAASNWSATNCWDTGTAPVTGDDVVLNNASSPVSTTYNLGAGVQLRSITLTQVGGDAVITGGPISLQSGGFITSNWNSFGNNDFPAVTLNGSATLTNTAANSNFRVTGAVTGTGPLTLSNSGQTDGMQLNVASSYTGATTITGSTRVLASVNGAIPTGSALTVGTGASLSFGASSTIGSLAGAGTVSIGGGVTLTAGGDNTSTTYSSVLIGLGALVKTGTGTLALTNASTHFGGTTVSGGTLQINAASVSGNITNNATLAFDQSTSATFAGVVSGTGGVTKTGAGTLTLSATNTYNGTTTVSVGTLLVNGSLAGSVSVAGGASLGGTGTISGNVSLAYGATIASGLTVVGTISRSEPPPPPSWFGANGSGALNFSSLTATTDASGRISVSIPSGNFNSTGLTYSVGVVGGSLPSWLSFDASTLTFSGTPPAAAATAPDASQVATPQAATDASGRWLATAPTQVAASLLIRITAQDASGASADALFALVANRARSQSAVVAASVTTAAAAGNGASAAPALSDDGGAVVFQSSATDLFGIDANRFADVVRYEVSSGLLHRFSTASLAGSIAVSADAASRAAAISADARAIAFASEATNIGVPNGNGLRQVWVADASPARVQAVTASPTLASTTAAGTQGDAASDNPALSQDGRYVAFDSAASNLVSGTAAGTRRVFRKDRTTGAIVLIGSGERPAISADGAYVAYDGGDGQVRRHEVASGAEVAAGSGSGVRMSRDGRHVAWQSGGQVLRRDLVLATTLVIAADGSGPSLSGDGRFVAYLSQGQIRVGDAVAGTSALVSTATDGSVGNAASSDPAISGDGRFIAFASAATNLVSGMSGTQLYLAGNPLSPPLSSGWWWNAAEPGRGYGVEVRGDRMMLGAFAYDGTGSPVWYAGTGALSDTAWAAALLQYAGGQTLTGSYRAASVLGTAADASLAVASSSTATLTAGSTGAIERFAFVAGGTTAGAQLGSPENGWWWNPAEPGTGWFLEIQGSAIFLAGFVYDTAGKAAWVFVTGTMTTATTYGGTLSRCTGGQALGGAYQSPTCSADQGAIALAFSSPLAATLTVSGRQVTIERFRF